MARFADEREAAEEGLDGADGHDRGELGRDVAGDAGSRRVAAR